MSMVFIFQPFTLVYISIAIVHSAPSTSQTLMPFSLIPGILTIKVCPKALCDIYKTSQGQSLLKALFSPSLT